MLNDKTAKADSLLSFNRMRKLPDRPFHAFRVFLNDGDDLASLTHQYDALLRIFLVEFHAFQHIPGQLIII